MYHILAVDDEAAEREGLRFLIERLGLPFKVTTASGGREALALAENTAFDCLITDIKMPFMDGLALCEAMRQRCPELIMVIYSAYNDFAYAKQAIHIRVDDYILKPVVVEEFQKTLQKIYERLEGRSQVAAKREKLLAEYSSANLLQKEHLLNAVFHLEEPTGEVAPAPPAQSEEVNYTVSLAIRCIEENYAKDIGLEWVANQIFLSPGYLSGLFKRETGKSVVQYITLCRLQKAKELLTTTNMRISDISARVGISSSSYFCLLFKKFYGVTAQQMREEVYLGQRSDPT